MKAMVYYNYGSPDVLKLEEVEKPTPGDDEVLVKIYAASVNALDWHALRADPFLYRFMGAGFLKPKNNILGADVSGRVEAVGRNVKQFQPGDEVIGDLYECGLGAFAQYVCKPENTFVLKPANLTFEEAAAAPSAANTALQGLHDIGQIQSGQKVLINGASGGVGTFAVQMAKSFGAEVTGVCSTRNLDLVRSLGADHVIDYTQEDFIGNGQRYDLIFDNVANRSVSDCKRALSPNGTYVACAFSPVSLFLGPLISMIGSNKVGTFEAKPNPKDLAILKDLLESGEVAPVIDRCYTLSELPEAIRYLEKGHARGKIVITIEQSDQTK